MKKALKIEFQKLKASRLFWMAAYCRNCHRQVQVFNNMTWVNHVLNIAMMMFTQEACQVYHF